MPPPAADPGYLVGVGSNPHGGDLVPTYKFARFSPKNWMKLRKLCLGEGGGLCVHHCPHCNFFHFMKFSGNFPNNRLNLP